MIALAASKPRRRAPPQAKGATDVAAAMDDPRLFFRSIRVQRFAVHHHMLKEQFAHAGAAVHAQMNLTRVAAF
jgi:hypothetical protein